jgi:hypothetical protein
MGFKFGVDNEKMQRPEPVAQGIYTLRLTAFNPKHSKDHESVNFQPVFTLVAPGEKYNDRELKFAFIANSKVPSLIQDMVHATGELMEGDANDKHAILQIPGIWDADPAKFDPKDASTWVYQGPLLNKELKAELYVDTYNNVPNNKILRFICAVPQCEQKFPKIMHSTNMNWGSK